MYIKCVACLTTTDAEHIPLSAVLPDLFKTNLSVSALLEVVTSTKVCKYISPNSICSACLQKLKDCYDFIQEFKKSQVWLEENLIQEMPEKQTVEMEEDEIGNNNVEEIILQVCKDEKEPALDMEMIKAPKKVHVNKAPVPKRIVKHIDHTYPLAPSTKVKELPYPIPQKKNKQRPIAPTKLREIKPKGVTVMSFMDFLNSNSKKIVLPSNMKQTEVKNEPDSIVMSVIDVLNSKKSPRVNKSKRRKIKVEKKEKLPYVCDVCNNMYASERALNGHKRRVHNPGLRDKLKCKECGLQCRSRSALAHHSGKHKEGEDIKCDQCEKVCLTIGKLKYHKMVAHGPEDYLCNHCGERFNYARALTFHEVTVHQIGDKPFMCRYCGFRCLQRGHLKRHERCHTDERPFKCKFKSCGKTFRGRSEMHSHHRVHEGIRTLECQYCGKMFFRMWNMKLHWLQHVGNYKCTICTKTFVEENVLDFHYFHQHKIRKEGKDEESEYKEEGEDSECAEEKNESEYLQQNLHDDELDLKYIMQSDDDNY